LPLIKVSVTEPFGSFVCNNEASDGGGDKGRE
jgi:hypothetical protein